MSSFTRGFLGRRGAADPRLPPGQYDTGTSWPVLSAEVVPTLDTATWTFVVEGLVEHETTWTWDELHALPVGRLRRRDPLRDHVVEVRHALGRGVGRRAARGGATAPVRDARLAFSHTGYTTNLPIEDVTDGRAWVAFGVDGAPLPGEHGGPARLLVPHLYFWKSAKWIAGLRVLDHDEPGFWEVRGYHDRGDPWLEQRYQGD